MSKPTLIIGNKNYSSWSLRPYMLLAMAGIAFDERMIRFGEPRFSRAVRKVSGAGQVPILLHKGNTVWDSLAIMEYVADAWPAKHIWPRTLAARAMARSMAAEMHSGFHALRQSCPMNIRRQPKLPPGGVTPAIQKNVDRLETMWRAARSSHGKGGPFLFGKFTAADAMFAPVCARLRTFAIPVAKDTSAYVDEVLATPAFQAWQKAALKERWIVPEDEVD